MNTVRMIGVLLENSKGIKFLLQLDGNGKADLFKVYEEDGELLYDSTVTPNREAAANMVFFRMEGHNGTEQEIAEVKNILSLIVDDFQEQQDELDELEVENIEDDEIDSDDPKE